MELDGQIVQAPQPVIEFNGVSKTYRSRSNHRTVSNALTDINLRINKGEFVFVVGSSGAGKSTFLKLIMREEKASTGTIRVNGFNLTKMRRKQVPKLRRTMGIVFQDFRLIPTMNVFQNVAFAMHVVGAKNKTIRKEFAKALALVGLGDKAYSMPNELSGGEQQRVGLARALVNAPALIIADEPTGNVDPNMSYEIVNLLNAINENGTTVLMVTHDHNLVRDFKHRVIMLDGGRVVADNAGGLE
ncbi:MAG: cell division ATP-binding protein FtsE [Clostridiales bacterium]|nr:cell division ATP-binding protein FtsE [Candidatus Equinaster intestinalis]